MTSHPLVVLISGPAASGKTTLSREIAPAIGLPLIAKDDIKESLLDSLGMSDIEWSMKVGAATWDLLFLLLERIVSVGGSVVVEGNWYPYHGDRLAELRGRHRFRIVEVNCTAARDVLEERFRSRERHPGHHDDERVFTWPEGQHDPLDVSDHVIRVDTTDPSRVDIDSIVSQIRGGHA